MDGFLAGLDSLRYSSRIRQNDIYAIVYLFVQYLRVDRYGYVTTIQQSFNNRLPNTKCPSSYFAQQTSVEQVYRDAD